MIEVIYKDESQEGQNGEEPFCYSDTRRGDER